MKKLMLIGLLLLILGGVGVGLTFTEAQKNEQQTLSTDISEENINELFVKVKNSSVTVERSSQEDIVVTYTGNTNQNKLVTDVHGTELFVEVKSSHWKLVSFDFFARGNKLTIALPEKLYDKIKVDSKNGSIHIANLDTEQLDVKTANGSITTEAIAGNVDAYTDNGSVNAKNITGSITAETSNGRIRLAHITGDVTGKTENGSVVFENDKVTQQIALTSSNGSVTLELSERLDDVTLNLKTELGTIKINGDKNWHPVVGAGTYDVQLKTELGSIKINAHE